MDHSGLLEILARRSGAEVAALAPLAPWLRAISATALPPTTSTRSGVMRRHGVPDDLGTVLGAVAAAFRAYRLRRRRSPIRCIDGGVLELRDRSLRVLHRPGHSPTDTVLWDAERRGLLIAGDHLLAHISSNPLISRPLDATTADCLRPRPLLDYVASMRATREMPVPARPAGARRAGQSTTSG